MIHCRECDEEITFSSSHVSESGKKIPLDPDTMEPHDCPENTFNRLITCHRCSQEITFSDDMISASGKKIPLDAETEEPHKCKASRLYRICNNGCGKLIYFDGDNPEGRSKNGKWVPLDKDTNKTHDCPKNKRAVR